MATILVYTSLTIPPYGNIYNISKTCASQPTTTDSLTRDDVIMYVQGRSKCQHQVFYSTTWTL